MIRAVKIMLGFLIVAVAFWLGTLWGYKKGAFNAGLEENKLAVLCLKSDTVGFSPEFREYLKGRIYYNIATKYPNDRGYLLRKDWDFGPVNLDVLKGRIYAKDPNFGSDSYDDATKHLSNAEPD